MDRQMNYRGYHTLRWTAGLVASSALTLYVFRDEITEWFGNTGAGITSRTLGDESVQREARELARGFVYELLNDKKALSLTTEFLNTLLRRDYTREAVVELLGNVAQEEQTQVLLADLFRRVLSDPVFVNNASLFVQDLCGRETTKNALISLFAAVFADPEGQRITAEFFKSVMESETFTESANLVASQSTRATLENEELKHHAVKWVRDVLGEPDLHSQAGDAIWGALRSTFIPGFLRAKPARITENHEEQVVKSTNASAVADESHIQKIDNELLSKLEVDQQIKENLAGEETSEAKTNDSPAQVDSLKPAQVDSLKPAQVDSQIPAQVDSQIPAQVSEPPEGSTMSSNKETSALDTLDNISLLAQDQGLNGNAESDAVDDSLNTTSDVGGNGDENAENIDIENM